MAEVQPAAARLPSCQAQHNIARCRSNHSETLMDPENVAL